MARAGYKEGYLTKRGKNFGGWKTRYFVLQGPSLEYYESVSVTLITPSPLSVSAPVDVPRWSVLHLLLLIVFLCMT